MATITETVVRAGKTFAAGFATDHKCFRDILSAITNVYNLHTLNPHGTNFCASKNHRH